MKIQFEEQDIKELISDHLAKISKSIKLPKINVCFEINIKLNDIKEANLVCNSSEVQQ